jgi:hypothetical protein
MHERGKLEWIDHPQFGRIVVANEYAAGEITLTAGASADGT